MKLTFLGTGTSTGVPSIACDCETCVSDDPRDKRLRVSVLVEHAGKTILVDTSSDFRQQALRADIRQLDAVLITHCHVDHVFGLDDIRPLNFRYGAMPIFANEIAWIDLKRIFQYIFQPTHFGGGLPQLIAHTVRLKPHSTHLNLDEALEIIADLKPKRAYLTHLNHDILHERDSKLLPDNVQFAWDELVIESQ